MQKEITVWHVEMLAAEFVQSTELDRQYELKQTVTPLPELNRFLYATVGAPWLWYMRLQWSYQEWLDYLSSGKVETWIAYQGATPVGYFELEKQPMGSVEIGYFGLLPDFIGKGLGGALLTDAINRAFSIGGKRVWLHTCTLDHPQALPNYLARGFRIFKEETFMEELPDEQLDSWPGAQRHVR